MLSHASAASAWDFRPVCAGAIHVTVPGGRARAARWDPPAPEPTLEIRETTTNRVSRSPPRSAPSSTSPPPQGPALEHALDLAEQRGLIDFAELQETITAHPTRPGSPSF